MKTIIIIPTYNEIDNVRPLLQEIFLHAPDTDVLIVDDNSPDGTGKLADEIHDEDSRVSRAPSAGLPSLSPPKHRLRVRLPLRRPA